MGREKTSDSPISKRPAGPSFSRAVRSELLAKPCRSRCCRETELATFVLAGGIIPNQGQWRVHPRTPQIAGRFAQLAQAVQSNVTQAEKLDGMLAVKIPELLRQAEADELPLCCRQAFVRALFLVCGMIADPRNTYRLELTIRPAASLKELLKILRSVGFDPAINRSGPTLILQDGQQLVDYLLLAGAQQALLDVESLRVEKEMRNAVNRIVNCDSANTQRTAAAAALQIKRISRLKRFNLLQRLPEDLAATAQLRLDHPDLSLPELGALHEPPLGKSGMYHRLRRLLAEADRLESEAEGRSGDAP